MTKRTAVILFNLGGPDKLESVKPFLFNLFNDAAIINIPQPFRWLLAKFISFTRENLAKKNYSLIGGFSPILKGTKEQAKSLEISLNMASKDQYSVFVCMRHWHPFTEEIASKVKKDNFDEIILLPLYPQFSTTTTGSSIERWHNISKKINLNTITREICCYPADKFFIKAHADLINMAYKKCHKSHPIRILFSAHGLPQKVIDRGDPYQHHIESTVKEIIKLLPYDNLDYKICYQSKVGPLKWLEPSTENSIIEAAKDKIAVLIVPLAFVSEHIETLVELDLEYKELAKHHGIPGYFRVAALGTHKEFIKSLTNLCLEVDNDPKISCSSTHKCCLRRGQNCV